MVEFAAVPGESVEEGGLRGGGVVERREVERGSCVEDLVAEVVGEGIVGRREAATWRCFERAGKVVAQSAKGRVSELVAERRGWMWALHAEARGKAERARCRRGVERADGGGFGVGGNGLAPEVVLLRFVEEHAEFVAGEDEIGEERGGPLRPGEDGRRVPGGEAERALAAIEGETEG